VCSSDLVGGGVSDVRVIDISNPESPQLVGVGDTDGFDQGVLIIDDIAYVASGAGGMQVLNVANAAYPTLVGGVVTPGHCSAIVLDNGYLYVADGPSGLQVLKIQCDVFSDCNENGVEDWIEIDEHPSLDWNSDGILDICQQGQSISDVPNERLNNFTLHNSYPNPFNPQATIVFEMRESRLVSLYIYDAKGRLVRALLNGELGREGRNEIVWNGRDDTGRRVASGTFFYRLESGDYSETKRMALIK